MKCKISLSAFLENQTKFENKRKQSKKVFGKIFCCGNYEMFLMKFTELGHFIFRRFYEKAIGCYSSRFWRFFCCSS